MNSYAAYSCTRYIAVLHDASRLRNSSDASASCAERGLLVLAGSCVKLIDTASTEMYGNGDSVYSCRSTAVVQSQSKK